MTGNFLIEANTQDVLKLLIADCELSIPEAMRRFYILKSSKNYRDIDTGLYLESPAYIYDLYLNELKNSKIVQDEI